MQERLGSGNNESQAGVRHAVAADAVLLFDTSKTVLLKEVCLNEEIYGPPGTLNLACEAG